MIEIIPRPVSKLPFSQNILFYFSALLIFLVVLGYFILDFYLISGAERKLQELDEALARTKTEEQVMLEKELSGYEKKIKNFSALLGRHVFFSRTFNFFEENTHPDAWFSSFSLNPGKGQVGLSGETDNFVTLHQQVRILKENPSVKGVNLTNIAIGKEGRINFDIGLTLDPGLLK